MELRVIYSIKAQSKLRSRCKKKKEIKREKESFSSAIASTYKNQNHLVTAAAKKASIWIFRSFHFVNIRKKVKLCSLI